jgi:hypothetical protein
MAFFATPTRAWEFAAGGLIAILGGRSTGGRRRHPALASLAAWSGLAIIVFSFVAISGSDPFPGWIAILPVAGTALVIAAGDPEQRWSPRALIGIRPVQWLGDNSYSVYLWHWPLIIAAPWVLHGSVSNRDRALIVAMSLALAAATKRYIEDPARTGSLWRRRNWSSYAFAFAGVAALALLTSSIAGNVQRSAARTAAAYRHVAEQQTRRLLTTHTRSCFGAAAMLAVNDCQHPFARPKHLDTAFATTDGLNDPCLEKYDAATPIYCVRGAQHHVKVRIALVGNSHAWRLIPALSLYGSRHHWQIITATRINCLGVITAPIGHGSGATPNCIAWSTAVLDRFLRMHNLDAVIFASYRYADEFVEGESPSPTDLHAAQLAIQATWTRLRQHGIRVIVTGDVPGMRPTLDPACIAQSVARNDPCATRRLAVVHPNLLSSLAQQHPDLASYIPLTQYFCDARRCHGLIGGVIVYFDSHHLTTTFSRSLARYLGADVKAALTGASPALSG